LGQRIGESRGDLNFFAAQFSHVLYVMISHRQNAVPAFTIPITSRKFS
jgi:hypothetical protein